MNAIRDGSIVRVLGKNGDWRVLHGGLTLGTHLPTVYLENVGESWVKHLTALASDVYPSPGVLQLSTA